MYGMCYLRHLLVCLCVIQIPLQNVAQAQDLALSCDGTMNIKSVDRQDQIVQDKWYTWKSELQLGNGVYFRTTEQGGHTYLSDGTVQVTPTRYILFNDTENPFGDFSQMYIDRITGRYYDFAVKDDTLITTITSTGVCQMVDAPKPKF
jgi:hypothetical protein